MKRNHHLGRSAGRKSLFIAATAVSVSLAMSGCSSSAPAGSSASQTVGGQVTYSFWGNPARAEKVKKVIDLYQKEVPGASITPEVADYNSYIERLTVRAAGGQLPCVLGTQSTFYSTYADKRVLMPLDDLIKSGQIDTSNIPQKILDAGKIDGKQYMIPTGTFSRLMGYNADLVKAAGVQPPSDDMTWEDYAKWLKELQPKLPAGVKATEIEGPIMFSFTSWVIGHGQEMFKDGKLGFSKELMQQWFQYWIDLTNAGVTTPPANIPDQTAVLELSPLALGNAAAGTRDIPNFAVIQKTLQGAGKPATIEQISIPAEDAKESANVLGANGLSIPSNCNNIGTAASFINYFTNNPDAAAAFQSDNGILSNTKTQEALVNNAETAPAVKKSISVFQKLTTNDDLTTSTYPDGYQSLVTELNRQYQAAAFGQISIADAVDQFFNKAATALK